MGDIIIIPLIFGLFQFLLYSFITCVCRFYCIQFTVTIIVLYARVFFVYFVFECMAMAMALIRFDKAEIEVIISSIVFQFAR